MRFHTTLDFSDARRAHSTAWEAIDVDLGETESARASAIEDRAFKTMMLETPAITPTEVSEKLSWFIDREVDSWKDGRTYREAIFADLKRQQAYPVSPAMLRSWAAWRKAELGHYTAVDETEQRELCDIRCKLYCEIMLADCVTPGDYILKQYLRLLTSESSLPSGMSESDRTYSHWEVAFRRDPDAARMDVADVIGCLRDIDGTDLGQNLLAYGHPNFSAEAWMERAETLGMTVHVIEGTDGGHSLSIGLIDEPASEYVRRQRDRLRALLAFRCAVEDRARLVAEEIRENWPHLICRPSVTEVN